MQNGVYKVVFQVGPNYGSGVVTIHDGRLTGGDSGFVYIGSFTENGANIDGTVEISQHDATAQNVFSGLSNFLLTFGGQAQSASAATLHGQTAAAPGSTVHINLTLIQAI